MPNPLPDKAKSNPTQYNIEAIAKLEQDALERRTSGRTNKRGHRQVYRQRGFSFIANPAGPGLERN